MSQWSERQEKNRQLIRRECDRRGLRIRPYGNAWWIEGMGVSIITHDLADMAIKELEPHLVTAR